MFRSVLQKSCSKSFFSTFRQKHLYQCLFFNKVTGLQPLTLLKRIPQNRCFRVIFANISKKVCFIEYIQKTDSTKFINQKIMRHIPALCYEKLLKMWLENEYSNFQRIKLILFLYTNRKKIITESYKFMISTERKRQKFKGSDLGIRKIMT